MSTSVSTFGFPLSLATSNYTCKVTHAVSYYVVSRSRLDAHEELNLDGTKKIVFRRPLSLRPFSSNQEAWRWSSKAQRFLFMDHDFKCFTTGKAKVDAESLQV